MAKNAAGGPSRIVVAVDGSKDSTKAAETAVSLSSSLAAELFVVSVAVVKEDVLGGVSKAEEGELGAGLESEAQGLKLNLGRSAVDEAVAAAKNAGVAAKGDLLQTDGSVVEAILDYQVEKKGDMIVLGTRGRGGFKRLLMGSVSNGVVTHADCSVLVVR